MLFQVAQAQVHRNPIEPRRETGASIEGLESPVGTEKGFLGNILRIVCIPCHPVGQPEKVLLVLPNQGVKGGLVALSESRNQGKIRLFHLA
jgi:hypothetical protein